MTTEKKKRTPKPTMTPEVNQFIAFYLPLLNATDKESILREAVMIGQYFDRAGSYKSFSKQNGEWETTDNTESNIAQAQRDWTDEHYEHLKETIGMIKKAIRYAIHGKLTFHDFSSAGFDICHWLEDSARVMHWHLRVWSGPRNTNVSLAYPKEWVQKRDAEGIVTTHWPRVVRAWGAWLVIHAFRNSFLYEFMGKPGQARPFPFAAEPFIGACPRCGKIFEKKQANAVLCGVYCQREGTRKEKK